MKLSAKDRLELNQGNYIHPESWLGLSKKEWKLLVETYGNITNPVDFCFCSQKTVDLLEQKLREKIREYERNDKDNIKS
jgi:hypothetical protein